MEEKGMILLVDDNSKNIQLLGNLLSNEGFRISVAMNGKQALNFLKENDPDLILLDVMMPGLNGYDVCKLIKEKERFENTPIIFLTAKSEPEDLIRGFEAGAVDYISKPFLAAELLARVKTHTRLKKTIDENLTLKGLIPICSSCKKIRNDKGYWQQLEVYIEQHSDAEFTHGICDECMERLYGDKDWYKNSKKL